ncbi:hypothetical protein CKO45_26015 [Paracraurococcus ruber]|uniref:Uncharacterized protein n=1 Tax=Paracraurococcus ruber TaxID=77675 RepID=A0ABS1D467_9PROT|nr:hypothetical protein [Paracraurococcus ruber]
MPICGAVAIRDGVPPLAAAGATAVRSLRPAPRLAGLVRQHLTGGAMLPAGLGCTAASRVRAFTPSRDPPWPPPAC